MNVGAVAKVPKAGGARYHLRVFHQRLISFSVPVAVRDGLHPDEAMGRACDIHCWQSGHGD